MALKRTRITTLPKSMRQHIPDVRDGLTEVERTILYVLYRARKEFGDRHIPTWIIYGRVVELIDVPLPLFQELLDGAVAKAKAAGFGGEFGD